MLPLPVQGVECVDIPAVLVETAHAVGRSVREESVQDGNLYCGEIKHILAFCFCHLLFKMSMRLLLKIGPLKVLSRVENFLCMIVDACTRNMILGIHYLLLKALLSMSMYYSTSNITASYLHSVITSTKFVNQSEMIRCKMYICKTI